MGEVRKKKELKNTKLDMSEYMFRMREKAQQIINFKMLRKIMKTGKITYFINLLPTHFY